MFEPLKKNFSTVTKKAAEIVGALTTSVEQDLGKIGEMKKEKDAVARELSKLSDGLERVEYNRDDLQAMLQLAQREWEKYVEAVNRV